MKFTYTFSEYNLYLKSASENLMHSFGHAWEKFRLLKID